MPQKKARHSNIELLRIITILSVIFLHYNNADIGGGLVYVEANSINYYVLLFLESLFACSVDLFVLISGYYLCESDKRNLWKPIELLTQVILFRVLVYSLRIMRHTAQLSLKTFLVTLLPLNYFVILYCTVYIISPYINILIQTLSNKSLHAFLLIIFIMFSVYPTFVDFLGEIRGEVFNGLSTIGLYGSQMGYTIVTFVLMYIIGAFLKKSELNTKLCDFKKPSLWVLIIGILITLWAVANKRIGMIVGNNPCSAWEYCNPLVIALAVFVFITFIKIDLGINRIINTLSQAVFTVFLIHQYFIPFLPIKEYVNCNLLIMLSHYLINSIIIFIICWIIHVIYHLLVDPIVSLLKARIKIPIISASDK